MKKVVFTLKIALTFKPIWMPSVPRRTSELSTSSGRREAGEARHGFRAYRDEGGAANVREQAEKQNGENHQGPGEGLGVGL